MSAGMAEVIAAHQGHEALTCIGGYVVDCLGCDWRTFSTSMPNEGDLHSAHVAEELAKVGYGNVHHAQVEAWSEGWAAGLLDASIPGRKESTNPYRESPHGVD